MIDPAQQQECEQKIQEENFLIQPCHLHLKRLDTLLRELYKTNSRTYFQRLIDTGLVLVNGQRVKKSYQLAVDDEVEVQLALTEELDLIAQDIPLDVIYEDEEILAVNKPAGMVVHPGHGNRSSTFANALLFYCKTLEQDGSLRPGIVHRLDKYTSGVLVAAKTSRMHQELAALFASRKISKKYAALCFGKVPHAGTIRAAIGRHPVYRKEMAVLQEGGKEAVTHYKLLASSSHCSLVEIHIETGRTHQIRVHMKHLGFPILGDSVYGINAINSQYAIKRQMLHCQSLTFIHPRTKQLLEIVAPLPDDICNILTKFAINFY